MSERSSLFSAREEDEPETLCDRLRDPNEENALIVRRQAAGEIERLRKALERVVFEAHPASNLSAHNSVLALVAIDKIARNALADDAGRAAVSEEAS